MPPPTITDNRSKLISLDLTLILPLYILRC
nr:MAG TPA: hypothetical protein [Caudoviricetes sp.]